MNTYIVKRVSLLSTLLVICGVFVFVSVININKMLYTVGKPSFTSEIVIDAGHGGFDGGSTGKLGIPEKQINLEIAKRLEALFQFNGFRVTMTRESDAALDRYKKNDMYKRLKIMNQNPKSITISIHQNIYSDSSSSGAQVFYSPNCPESLTLAQIVQENFKTKLQPQNNRKVKKAEKNLFLLTKAQTPAIMVECGFLSNYDEAQKLVNEEYQGQVAFTIFSAVQDFILTM